MTLFGLLTHLLYSIGDSEDQVGRMLGVLRFWFTKDLVRPIYRHGKLELIPIAIRQREAMQTI